MTTLVDLVALHKAKLGDAVTKVFTLPNDEDFIRHLQAAANRLIEKRPYMKRDIITLVAGQSGYSAADDLIKFSRYEWGKSSLSQFRIWEPDWPGPFPDVVVDIMEEGPKLIFMPAPTTAQIDKLGADFYYWYYASHIITQGTITVLPRDESLLLFASLLEAVRELATRNLTIPIQFHKNMSPLATVQTPLAWYHELTVEWSNLT